MAQSGDLCPDVHTSPAQPVPLQLWPLSQLLEYVGETGFEISETKDNLKL